LRRLWTPASAGVTKFIFTKTGGGEGLPGEPSRFNYRGHVSGPSGSAAASVAEIGGGGAAFFPNTRGQPCPTSIGIPAPLMFREGMIREVGYSRRAVVEAEEIVRYLREYSETAARRFDEALRRAEHQLGNFPRSGTPGIRPGTRRLIIGNCIASYRRRGDGIEIFAVRHSRRRDARL
jgi:plasmid stabilization system protein ParE